MTRILAAVLILLLAAASPALAQGKSKDKGNKNGKGGKPEVVTTTDDAVDRTVDKVVDVLLGDEEKETIRNYYKKNPDAAGKVKELPPGIRKKIARGGTMPPGIAKQVLPDGLHRQLPQRDGYDYNVVGSDVVLVDKATDVIVDVLKDVLGGG